MNLILETGIITAVLVVFARILYGAQGFPIINEYYATIFAVAFLYVPILVLWRRGRKVDFIDDSARSFLKCVWYFVLAAVIVFPPYLICAHFWMIWVYGREGFHLAAFPDFWKTAVFQVLLIALPEEFFFRGYMQTTLNRIFGRPLKFFGANIGLALPITSVVFAFSHSFVHYAWWHFSIFLPALLFGWLRERTGSITAPILFHALSNIISDWVVRSYY